MTRNDSLVSKNDVNANAADAMRASIKGDEVNLRLRKQMFE